MPPFLAELRIEECDTCAHQNASLYYISKEYITTHLLSLMVTWSTNTCRRDRFFGTIVMCTCQVRFHARMSGPRNIHRTICSDRWHGLTHSWTHSRAYSRTHTFPAVGVLWILSHLIVYNSLTGSFSSLAGNVPKTFRSGSVPHICLGDIVYLSVF